MRPPSGNTKTGHIRGLAAGEGEVEGFSKISYAKSR